MKNVFLLFFATACIVTSCKKEPGIGGDASISGQIIVNDYNGSFTNIIGQYPAEDEYVYIIYGDHTGFDKRVKTDYNGYFLFEHLYEGDYTIYVYSADSTQTELDGRIPVIKKLNLSERKQNLDAGQITIAK
jgi:hypothetical protein